MNTVGLKFMWIDDFYGYLRMSIVEIVSAIQTGFHVIGYNLAKLIIFLFILCTLVQEGVAGQIRLAWYPNSEKDLVGYELYYGSSFWTLGEPIKLKKVTMYTLKGLEKGETYYIAITAYNERGLESWFSNLVSGIAHNVLHGQWMSDMSGTDTGGMVLRFDDGNNRFSGYGISDKMNFFGIEGNYSLSEDETTASGTYRIYDYDVPDLTLYSGNLSGEIDSEGEAAALIMDNPPINLSSVRILRDPANPPPAFPENWTAKLSGKLKGTLDQVKIEKYEVDGETDYSHTYTIEGTGALKTGESIDLDGSFILTPGNKVYGVYQISGGTTEQGYFSGTVKKTWASFTFKCMSDSGSKYTLKGKVTP